MTPPFTSQRWNTVLLFMTARLTPYSQSLEAVIAETPC